MGKVSKRAASIALMKTHQTVFSCPICKEGMEVTEDGQVICDNNHSFIIAKQGYVNLMVKPTTSMYSKNLFESRKDILNSGLYDPLQQAITKYIGKDAKTLLDTGCGEGSHLERICSSLDSVLAVGIDISKEGIQTAAKYYENKIWCVGDLANSPFKEQSFDVILNILSPANYDEFIRLLKPNGKVIKVVPQSNYLKEIREQAFAQTEKETYSNKQTVERFKECFTNFQQERITYTCELEPELIPKLLEMTPLGWHLDKEVSIQKITIDLDILIGEYNS
ncbi:putative RNA methyltransferase [Lysinibacillus endophyticus]|uniref:putative RNA methyltransferase n=1 Tax=Ureibacillus endophyticus TaxID=1978490 RepID=UPI003136A6F3